MTLNGNNRSHHPILPSPWVAASEGSSLGSIHSEAPDFATREISALGTQVSVSVWWGPPLAGLGAHRLQEQVPGYTTWAGSVPSAHGSCPSVSIYFVPSNTTPQISLHILLHGELGAHDVPCELP